MLITIFITYIKRHMVTGDIYAGRTSGKVKELTPDEIEKVLRKRDSSHQRNKEGFGRAELDEFSTKYPAIRGQEQRLIDDSKEKGICANKINGISPRNPKRALYMAAALEAFAEVALLLYFTF